MKAPRLRSAKEGDRFGMLVVIDLLDDAAIRCRCDCGARVKFSRANAAASAKSCGCVRRAVPKNEDGRGSRSRRRPQRPSYSLSSVKLIQNAPRTITGRQLAEATGMTEGNVSHIRNGRIRARPAQAVDKHEARAIAIVMPLIREWSGRQRTLGLITPDGIAAVERLIEDLR
jgi:transcriptional regulator with XRE-family HTH domain